MSALSAQFQKHFGRAPAVVTRAPGRVEFIGNHTDYNGGAVLGAAIDRYVTVAAAANADGLFRLRSTGENPDLDLTAVPEARLTGAEAWGNYPLGVWRSLADFNLPQPAGFDLLVDSDLPAGAGLSSSAALELATALALIGLTGAKAIEPAQLAALGRHAENKYVGVPCGILDQGTSAFGVAGQLVLIDCRGPVFSRVPLPGSSHLWIFNTREKHALIDGLYATRHRECLEAAKRLGVALLAELTPAQLEGKNGSLGLTARGMATAEGPDLPPEKSGSSGGLALPPEKSGAPGGHALPSEKNGSSGRLALPADLAKRARHVVDEHARVRTTVEALAAGDLVAAGKLLTASHRSSQHLFENSTPALDRLVDLLEKHPAVLGARLTGGGFGGAVMALTRDTFTPADATEIAAQSGSHPEVIHLQTADGARVIS